MTIGRSFDKSTSLVDGLDIKKFGGICWSCSESRPFVDLGINIPNYHKFTCNIHETLECSISLVIHRTYLFRTLTKKVLSRLNIEILSVSVDPPTFVRPLNFFVLVPPHLLWRDVTIYSFVEFPYPKIWLLLKILADFLFFLTLYHPLRTSRDPKLFLLERVHVSFPYLSHEGSQNLHLYMITNRFPFL